MNRVRQLAGWPVIWNPMSSQRHPHLPYNQGSRGAHVATRHPGFQRAAPPLARGRQGGGREPWDLLMLAAAGLLLVGQARVHVFIPGASAFRPALLLGGLCLGLWVLSRHPARSLHAISRDSVAKAALFVLAWAVIGIPFALSFGSAANFLLTEFSRTFLLFIILAAAVRSMTDVRRLLGAFALGAAVFAVMAPVQRGLGRSVGGYDPNDAAMFLVSGLPPLVYFAMTARSITTRIAAAFGALAVIGAIVATQSRGGFVALVAVLTFMIILMKGVRPVARLVVVAAVILAAVPAASSEYWARIESIRELDDGYGGEGRVGGRRNIWRRAIEYTVENPLTGVGLNQFTRAEGNHPEIRSRIDSGIGTKYSAAHSTWFQALAEMGIPGFAGFILLFGLSFRNLRRLERAPGIPPPPPMSSPDLRTMAGALMAALVGVMTAGSFLTHTYSSLLWGVLGIIVGLGKIRVLTSGRGFNLDQGRHFHPRG
jgi:putative inorganic carbon (hco3(-)) transporter